MCRAFGVHFFWPTLYMKLESDSQNMTTNFCTGSSPKFHAQKNVRAYRLTLLSDPACCCPVFLSPSSKFSYIHCTINVDTAAVLVWSSCGIVFVSVISLLTVNKRFQNTCNYVWPNCLERVNCSVWLRIGQPNIPDECWLLWLTVFETTVSYWLLVISQ